MTIAELYAWAVENYAEDCPVEIQLEDDEGHYKGNRDLDKRDIFIDGTAVVL